MRVNSPVKLRGSPQPSNQGLLPLSPPTSPYARPTSMDFSIRPRTTASASSTKTSAVRELALVLSSTNTSGARVVHTETQGEGRDQHCARARPDHRLLHPYPNHRQPLNRLASAHPAFALWLDEPGHRRCSSSLCAIVDQRYTPTPTSYAGVELLPIAGQRGWRRRCEFVTKLL
ncbi:hypothetical protein PENSPDRAFT_367645 [Peniophora sp. CONT]|nr:hypothetical protein PENSPDRAFT_367645 [Peniophora sp. CONT]